MSMEFEKLDSKDIEINILKSKVESLEHQVQFLTKNWAYWTKNTQETGQRIMIALEKIDERQRQEAKEEQDSHHSA